MVAMNRLTNGKVSSQIQMVAVSCLFNFPWFPRDEGMNRLFVSGFRQIAAAAAYRFVVCS